MSGENGGRGARTVELPAEYRALSGCGENLLALVAELERLRPGLLGALIVRTENAHSPLRPTQDEAARAIRRALVSLAERNLAQGITASFADSCELLVLEDLGLAELALSGDARAWEILRELVAKAISLLSARTGQGKRGLAIIQELREDLLGAFLLQEKLLTYRATAPLVPWIRQIAFNRFRERLLEMKRRSTTEPLFSDLNQDPSSPLPSLPPASTKDALATIAAQEWETALRLAVPEALAALPTSERRMMEVLPTRTLTQVQLCEELGVSPFTLNRWYKDARQRFLRLLVQDLRFRLGLLDVPTEEIARWIEQGPQ